jgi:hypothetical protein
MPIVVDEVVITVEVGNAAGGGTATPPAPADDRQALVAECVAFRARSRRRGTLLRECPRPSASSLISLRKAPHRRARFQSSVDRPHTSSASKCAGHRVLPAAK